MYGGAEVASKFLTTFNQFGSSWVERCRLEKRNRDLVAPSMRSDSG
jgi:hypothetical protein